MIVYQYRIARLTRLRMQTPQYHKMFKFNTKTPFL